MSPQFRRLTPLCLSLSLLLAACGGDGAGAPSASNPNTTPSEITRKITVVPSLGQIRQADVIVTQLSTGKEIAREVTGTSGIIIFDKIPSNVGIIKIEVRATANSVYFDEALNQFVPFQGSMHTIFNLIDDTSVAITPWTEAAYQYALTLSKNKTPTLAQLTTAFDTFAKQAGTPILHNPPTMVDDQTDLAKLTAVQGDAYALSLATLAYQARQTLGNTEPTPALQVLRAFSLDAVDGKIDGQGATGALANLPYQSSGFFDEYSNQINRLIANFKLSDNLRTVLQPKAPELPPVATDPSLQVLGDSAITEFQPVSKTTALEGTDVVYRWLDANNGFIAVYIQENGKIRQINFSPTPNKAYQCFDVGCAGVTVTNGGRQINFNNTPMESSGVKLNGSLIAISPPSTDNQISVVGSISTTSFALLNFQPDTFGFESLIDTATLGGETFIFRQGNTATLTVQTDATGRVTFASLQAANRDWRCQGRQACQGLEVVNASSTNQLLITLKVNNAQLQDLNNATDTISLPTGQINGSMTAAAATTYRDLPLSTTGSIRVNDTTDEILAAQYQVVTRNAQAVKQVTVATPQLKMVVEQNQVTQVSTASVDVYSTGKRFTCQTNCGNITISPQGLVSLEMSKVIVNTATESLQLDTKLQLTPAVQGSMTSTAAALKTFAPTRSSINANNEWLTLHFELPQNGSSMDVRFHHSSLIATSVILNIGNGAESYSCYNPQRTTDDVVCSGISISENKRGVRFVNTKLKGGSSTNANQLITLNSNGSVVVAQGR